MREKDGFIHTFAVENRTNQVPRGLKFFMSNM